MKIDTQLILRLEELARLELSEEERQRLTADLNNILGMVGKMDELDTSHVEPLVYITAEMNVLREDQIKNQVTQASAFTNAPDHDGEHFKVPKVL